MNEHQEIEGLANSAEHEELVRRVLLEEVPQADERVHRLVAGCPRCSTQLKEHAQISAMLNEGGDLEMQSILREALEMDQFPGDEQVDRVLSSLAAGEPVGTLGGGRWRFRSVAMLAAAAALILAVVLTGGFGEEEPTPERATHLGPTQEAGEGTTSGAQFGPQGHDADFSRVYWELEIPDGGFYEVRVYDNTAGSRGELLITAEELEDPEWRPKKMEREKLTEAVLFEVVCFDAAGQRLEQRLSWPAWSVSE